MCKLCRVVYDFDEDIYGGLIIICRCLCCKKHGGDTIKIKLCKKFKHIKIKKKVKGHWPARLYIKWSKDLNLEFKFPKDFPPPDLNENEIIQSIPDNYKGRFKIGIAIADSGSNGSYSEQTTTVTIGDAKPTSPPGGKK